MIEVDAVVWYWSPEGMRNQHAGPGLGREGYVTRREAERLCEEAYLRGKRDMEQAAKEVIWNTT